MCVCLLNVYMYLCMYMCVTVICVRMSIYLSVLRERLFMCARAHSYAFVYISNVYKHVSKLLIIGETSQLLLGK